MKVKPLLVILKPRDVPEFEEATTKLKIDKMWMKYHPQEMAYTHARQIFLTQPGMTDYTHFIILPDDLIVTQRALDLLVSESEEYESISGWCNNTALKGQGLIPDDAPDVDSNISKWSPPPVPKRGLYKEYNWLSIEEVEHLRDLGRHVIPVLHQGFALTRLSRKLVELIPFRSSEGCCIDTCLSLDLIRMRIPQYVNTHIKLKHLYVPSDKIQVGKKTLECVVDKQQ